MSTTEPTDEMIEVAAKASWDLHARPSDPEWGPSLDHGVREEYRKDARAALRAALAVAPQVTEDDREALRQIISETESLSDPEGAWALPEDIADEILAAGFRRSPVAPSEGIISEAGDGGLVDLVNHFGSGATVATEKPGRLDPEWRADLVDAATHAIKAVWADVPGGVDAETLAQNVVSTQEFFWLSRQFPVAPSEDVAKLIERLAKASSAVYLATDKAVADDLSSMLREAADTLRSGAAVPVEMVTEFALEYPAGIMCVSDELADAEEMAQWVSDSKIVERTVTYTDWLPVRPDREETDRG